MGVEERYAKIRELAEKGATEGERKAAERALNRLRDRYGDIDLPEKREHYIGYQQTWARQLLVAIGCHLNLDVYTIVGARRVKWEGPTEFVELGIALYEHHHEELRKLLHWTAIGYTSGAFPITDEDEANYVKSPEHMADTLLAASEAGERAARDSRRALPD